MLPELKIELLMSVCVCVCVCVCGGDESERMWGRCEKGKVKESERHLLASVMNSFSAYVHW